VVEAASGSDIDPRWRTVRGDISLESSASLAALLQRPDAQALTGTVASGDSNFQIIAGEQSGWYGNSNDDEWNEESSHIISLAISREANVLMSIRGQQSSGEVVEINLRFGSTADSTYTGGSGYPGVNHYEDIPTGTWGHAAFDAGEVIRAQYGDSVDLAQIDGISVFGYGKTEIADFALLGTSHASYTAWGESLASALTGDLLSPLAQSAAWMRAGAAAPIGWQSKALDPALGLYFNHARLYSAGMGRFTQASPLGAAFEHLYGYGLNSPFGFTDVNGLYFSEANSDAALFGLGPVYPGADGGGGWGSPRSGNLSGALMIADYAAGEFFGPIYDGAVLIWDVCQGNWDNIGGDIAAFVPIVGGGLKQIGRHGDEAIGAIGRSGRGKRWRPGDPIDAPTAAGNAPSQTTIRERFWKNEWANNPGGYDTPTLDRMRGGRPPQRWNEKKGRWESMELHHDPAWRDGGRYDVTPMWPNDHARIDPHRHL